MPSPRPVLGALVVVLFFLFLFFMTVNENKSTEGNEKLLTLEILPIGLIPEHLSNS